MPEPAGEKACSRRKRIELEQGAIGVVLLRTPLTFFLILRMTAGASRPPYMYCDPPPTIGASLLPYFNPARFWTLKIGLFLFTFNNILVHTRRIFWKGTILTRATKYYIIITGGAVSNKKLIYKQMHLFKTDERMIFSSRVYALYSLISFSHLSII